MGPIRISGILPCNIPGIGIVAIPILPISFPGYGSLRYQNVADDHTDTSIPIRILIPILSIGGTVASSYKN